MAAAMASLRGSQYPPEVISHRSVLWHNRKNSHQRRPGLLSVEVGVLTFNPMRFISQILDQWLLTRFLRSPFSVICLDRACDRSSFPPPVQPAIVLSELSS